MKKKKYIWTCLVLAAVLCACGREPGIYVPTDAPKGPGTVVINTKDKTDQNYDIPEPTKDPSDPGNLTPTPTGTINRENGTFGAADMNIAINGITLQCGIDFLPFVDKFGLEPVIAQGQACLDNGFDTNYYYGDLFTVYTLAVDDKQSIFDIYVTGKGYGDGRGIVIGTTTRDKVHEIYGEPSKVNPTADKYSVSDTEYMTVEYEDDIVSAIDFYNLKQ